MILKEGIDVIPMDWATFDLSTSILQNMMFDSPYSMKEIIIFNQWKAKYEYLKWIPNFLSEKSWI